MTFFIVGEWKNESPVFSFICSVDKVSIPDWEDPLEKEMATHSSILAWKIPWTEEAGGLQSMESKRVNMTVTKQQFHIYWEPNMATLYVWRWVYSSMGFPGSSAGKESACNAGGPGSIPGLGRSPGEGIGYPLQYSWVSLVVQSRELK